MRGCTEGLHLMKAASLHTYHTMHTTRARWHARGRNNRVLFTRAHEKRVRPCRVCVLGAAR